MKEDSEKEDDLIRLSEILETIKKDALEVSDLLVTGIQYYKDLAWVCIVIGAIMAWQTSQYISSGNIFSIALYGLLSAMFFVIAPFGFYKNRRLKRKYKELIDIHKSLVEE